MKLNGAVNRILKRLKSGDDCFENLYDLTYNHLLVVARKYLKDKSLAEDAVSEAYISVFKNIESFNEKQNGYNWLYTIVKCKAYNINALTHNYDELNENMEYEIDIFEDSIIKSDISKALSILEKEERNLVFLRFFEDKTYAEIASIKKISAPMVHKSIKKIMKKMKKILKDFMNG